MVVHGAPCVYTDKAHGEDHFCTDSQKVNEVTKPDCYHLSRMKDCVDWVDGARFSSKLDLMKGYWQVLLPEQGNKISFFKINCCGIWQLSSICWSVIL